MLTLRFSLSSKFSILKVTFLDHFSSFPDLALSTLSSLAPFTFVVRVIIPVHLSETMPQVFNKWTFVETSSWPSIDTFPISLVIYVSPFIFFRPILPDSITKPQPIFEFSLVNRSITPSISALTLRFSIWIHAFVSIPIVEELNSLTVLVSIFDISIVLRQRGLDISLTLRFVELPSSAEEFFSGLPLSNPMFHAIDEATMIQISIGPNKDAILILRLIIKEFPYIHISINIFQTITIFTIILELSLIKP